MGGGGGGGGGGGVQKEATGMKWVNAMKNFKKTYNIFETWQSCSKRN